MSTTVLAPAPSARRVPVRPPVIGDRTTTFTLAVCAIVPFSGSPVAWAAISLLVLDAAVRHRDQLGQVVVSVPLLGYLTWMLLSLVWSVEPGHTALELFMNFNFVWLGLLIATNRTLEQLLVLFVRAATILLVLCWVVTLAVPSFGRMEDTSYTGAMKGLFVEKNMLGYFSVVALLSGIVRAQLPDARTTGAIRRWGPAALAASTILASTSKTALSVCIVGLLIGWVLTRLAAGRRPLALPLLAWTAGLLGLVVLGWLNWAALLKVLGRDATLTGRTKIWQVVGHAISQRPVQGYGWKALWLEGSPTTIRLWALNYGVPFFHAHNGYLDLAAQLGLVGLALALFFLLGLLVTSGSRFFVDSSPTNAWPLLLVVVVLIYNLTEVVSFTNTTWVLLVAFSSIHATTRKGKLCTSRTLPA